MSKINSCVNIIFYMYSYYILRKIVVENEHVGHTEREALLGLDLGRKS
jgi:hypothetical protein